MVSKIINDCVVMRFIAVGTFSFRLGNREYLPFDKEYRLLFFLVPINTYTSSNNLAVIARFMTFVPIKNIDHSLPEGSNFILDLGSGLANRMTGYGA